MIRWIKKLFKKYDYGYEYWIDLKEINIDPKFRATEVGRLKLKSKLAYYDLYGAFNSRIILDRNFNLLDGYSSIRVAEIRGCTKVPIYFAKCDIKGGEKN